MAQSIPIGHEISQTECVIDTLIGKDSDDRVMVISTAWDPKKRSGETIWVEMAEKSMRELWKNMDKKEHASRKAAFDFHAEKMRRFFNGSSPCASRA